MITLYTFGRMFGLPDASPFVTKAEVLLKMSGLPYACDTKGFGKAPKGKLPYIDDDGTIVADSTFIRWHLESRHGIDFDRMALTPQQKGIGWAAEKLCEDNIYWAVVESRWLADANFDRGPRRFFEAAPAPLRPLIVGLVRRKVRKALHAQGIGRHRRTDIERIASAGVDAIAAILGDKPWLFGNEPTGFDASVWAFMSSLLCPLFETPIRTRAEGHANLVAYAARGTALWYPELATRS